MSLEKENLSGSNNQVVVHLVHGTWPFGIFRRKSSVNKPAWFEDGSSFRRSVATQTNGRVSFEEYNWSGNNSFKDRLIAYYRFQDHLRDISRKHPSAKHVVIAHSHGGTVISRYLEEKFHQEDIPSLESIICLATPFVYIKSAYNKLQSQILPVAITNIIFATIALFFMPFAELVDETHPIISILAVVLSNAIVSGIIHFSAPDLPWEFRLGRNSKSTPPIFIFRATGDEAALGISLTQLLHKITERLFNWVDDSRAHTLLGSILRGVFIVVPITIIGYYLVSYFIDNQFLASFNTSTIWILSFISGLGVVGGLYFAGIAVLSFSTGLKNPVYWVNSIIEVDAAPPDVPVRFKSYVDLDEIEGKALRHGIYELTCVQLEIAQMLNSIANGSEPRFLSEKELECLVGD